MPRSRPTSSHSDRSELIASDGTIGRTTRSKSKGTPEVKTVGRQRAAQIQAIGGPGAAPRRDAPPDQREAEDYSEEDENDDGEEDEDDDEEEEDPQDVEGQVPGEVIDAAIDEEASDEESQSQYGLDALLLQAKQILQHLRNEEPTRRWAGDLSILREDLHKKQHKYMPGPTNPGSEWFISIEDAMKLMPTSEDPGWSRFLTLFFYLANIAEFLCKISVLRGGGSKRAFYDSLSESSFPEPFLPPPKGSHGETDTIAEISLIRLTYSIRANQLLYTLKSEPNANIEPLAATVFLAPGTADFKSAFKENKFKDVAWIRVRSRDDFKKACTELVEIAMAQLQGPDGSLRSLSDVPSMAEEAKFLHNLREWGFRKFDELKHELEDYERGIDSQERLDAGPETPTSVKARPGLDETLLRDEKSFALFLGKLENRGKTLAIPESSRLPPQLSGQTIVEEEVDREPPSDNAILDEAARQHMQVARPQPSTATRGHKRSPASLSGSGSPSRAASASRQQSPQKVRRFADLEVSEEVPTRASKRRKSDDEHAPSHYAPSEYDGSAHGDPDPSPPSTVGRGSRRARPGVNSRVRTSSPRASPRAQDHDYEGEHLQVRRAEDGSVEEAEEIDLNLLTKDLNLRGVIAAASQNSRLARLGPNGVQQRVPWSDRDSKLLIAAIAVHEHKWAELENKLAGKLESPRNYQALRDRARNLKVAFLLSDSPLPRGFDGVALSTKEKERVVKCRKNPYRQEIDIDDRGVINTEYIEEEEMV